MAEITSEDLESLREIKSLLNDALYDLDKYVINCMMIKKIELENIIRQLREILKKYD